jgi:ferredoxin, 2Fe-2S
MDSTSKIELRVSRGNEAQHVVRGISESEQRSILEILVDNKIEIDHSCGGNGTCGTCRIILIGPPKALSLVNSIELEMSQDRNFSPNERLACQTHILKSCEIKID